MNSQDYENNDALRLEHFEATISAAITKAALMTQTRRGGEIILDFDIRGELYTLAHRLAPQARQDELDWMLRWIAPKPGELGLDLAAGSGFLTKALCERNGRTIYALDPSASQLQDLTKHVPSAIPIKALPDDCELKGLIPTGQFDFVASLAGLHHVSDQRAMFANVGMALKTGGRFVIGDVCGGTSVARHFDGSVANKSLTGHTAQWLTPARIAELITGSGLKLTDVEIAPICMRFSSDQELYLFYRALHAYDISREEIIADVATTLGIYRENGMSVVRWPLLLARLDRQ